MKNLNFADVLGLLLIWAAGSGTVLVVAVYATKATELAILCAFIACYYLSKWIILKEEK